MQIFIFAVEETSQQRQRTRGLRDKCSFGSCADLRVVGHHAICPVTHRAAGKIQRALTCPRNRSLGLSEYWYRQNKKQRTDEQLSHGRNKTEARIETL